MDQTIINWLFAAFGATLGALIKVVWDAIRSLQVDLKQIERDLPEVYVRRDDFKSSITEVKEDMKELRQDMKDSFNKLDSTLNAIYRKLDTDKP